MNATDERQRFLAFCEGRIDRDVLSHISSNDGHRNFDATVTAIYNIVEDKLYKLKFHSLEQYFRNVWSISRAQAYRFHTCARILSVLVSARNSPLGAR